VPVLTQPMPLQVTSDSESDSEASPKYKDCPLCRIVGSATFATIGTYALWQSRAAAPGSPLQRRMVAGLGLGMRPPSVYTSSISSIPHVAFLAGSVVRWLR
jgi:hypothetical protein